MRIPWALAADDDRFLTMPYMEHHRILSAIPDEPASILDVGCGKGILASRLKEGGHTVTGVEIDPERAALAAPHCDWIIQRDLRRIDWEAHPRRYDILLLTNILEHLGDPGEELKRMLPVLKPDGLVIISVPNVANWRIRARLMVGIFDYDGGVCAVDHLHFFTFKSARGIVEAAGLRVIDCHPVPDVPLIRHKKHLERTHYQVASLLPGLLSINIFLVCELAISRNEYRGHG